MVSRTSKRGGHGDLFLVPKFHFFSHEKKSLAPFSIYLDFAEGFGFFFKNIVSLWRSIFAGYSYMGFYPYNRKNRKELVGSYGI